LIQNLEIPFIIQLPLNQPNNLRLKISLNEAVGIDESEIVDKIISIGYKCQKCARCCMEDFGDNTVSIFPFEIRLISEKTGLKWEDIAVPTPSEDRDDAGNIHTFEWILRKIGTAHSRIKGFVKYTNADHIFAGHILFICLMDDL